MKILEYIKIIETPLDNFEIHGDLNKEGSFSLPDLTAMKNTKWIEKVKSFFEKTPFDFNIYLINAENGTVNFDGNDGIFLYDPDSNINFGIGENVPENIVVAFKPN